MDYNRNSSPDQVTTESAFESGINCLTLVHMYWEEVLGWFVLDKEHGCTGLNFYQNKDLFTHVSEKGPFIEGDVFLFGRAGLTDFHKLHLAVFAGEHTEKGEPLLLHATNYSVFCKDKPDGGVFGTSLPRMLKQRQWQVLYGVRRWKL